MPRPAASLLLRRTEIASRWLLAAFAALTLAAFAPRAWSQVDVGQVAVGQVAVGQVAVGQVTAAQVTVAEPPTWAACDAARASGAKSDSDFAAFCAGVRAERSMQALSRRYSELWARLASDQRSEFSVAERRWLSSGRYAERDACVAHHTKSGVVDADLHAGHLAAECLAQVTARRLAHVELRYAATQRAASR